jgi:hypothetical protein
MESELSESKLNEYRANVRNEADKRHGMMIFELHHHDIFEFSNEEDLKYFSEWAGKEKKVKAIETGVSYRVAVKYNKHRMEK